MARRLSVRSDKNPYTFGKLDLGEVLFEPVDDQFSDIQRRRGRWRWRILDMQQEIDIKDAKIVNQRSVRSDRLGPHSSATG